MAGKKFSAYSNVSIPNDGDRLLYENSGSTNSLNQTYAQLKTDFLNNSDLFFNIFNSSDITKKISIAAGNISTGTTRTITMPDRNVTLDNISSGITTNNFGNTRIP